MDVLWGVTAAVPGALCGVFAARRYAYFAGRTAFAAALLFVCIYLRLGITPGLPLWLAAGGLLVFVSVSDLKTGYIPDLYVILLAALGAVWQLLSFLADTAVLPLWDALLGAACGALPLLLVHLLVRKLWQKEAFGFGDVKLMAACGLLLGWRLALLSLCAGVVLGGFAAALLLAARKAKRDDMLPFGPFLSIGVIAAALWGDVFFKWFFAL